MDVEKLILDQIDSLEKQIAMLRTVLVEVQRFQRKQGDPKMRFFDSRPLDAARKILEENRGRMGREEVIRLMVDGGLTHGKKRGMANIQISLDLNIENGNLLQKGKFLELPK